MFLGDYHTHTIYSHGKGDIIDNAREALSKGLKEIAITDHCYGHLLYGVKRDKVEEMRKKISEAEKETGIKIYLGMEANFTSTKGDIDLTPEELDKLDILIVGHHRFVKSSFKDKFKFFLPNMLLKSKISNKTRELNTQVILQALDKYPIDVLVHLNHDMHIDLKRVAEKAKETNTLIEINTSKQHFSDEDFKILLESGVDFIVNSDAHKPENVGNLQEGNDRIFKYNIPENRIVNFNKIPVFKKFKNKNI